MILLKSKKVVLQKIVDKHGNLSVIEEDKDIPFKIKRTYWIYDVPAGQKRGGHAFKVNDEFIIALSGSFDLILKDGISEARIHLNCADKGVYIPAGVWRELNNFSTNALVLVLASSHYNPDDYIWDYSQLCK